jgi:hypothetical protein
MYDKRYTEDQIKSIRWWAGAKMFVVMSILCWGVARFTFSIAYNDGYTDGYHASYLPELPKKEEAPVAKSMRLEIQPIPETNLTSQKINHPGCWKCQLRNGVNWIIKYWFICFLALACLAFYMFSTYPRRNVAKVKGERNVIIQSHSGLYPPDTPI